MWVEPKQLPSRFSCFNCPLPSNLLAWPPPSKCMSGGPLSFTLPPPGPATALPTHSGPVPAQNEGLTLRPHTSERCPNSLPTKLSGARTSRCKMLRSLDPEESRLEPQARVPTRARWPSMVRRTLARATSQIWTYVQ